MSWWVYLGIALVVYFVIFVEPKLSRNIQKQAEDIAAGRAVSADWTKPITHIEWKSDLTATVYISNKDFPAELISPEVPRDRPLYITSMQFSTHHPMRLLLTDKKPGLLARIFKKKAYMPWPAPIVRLDDHDQA